MFLVWKIPIIVCMPDGDIIDSLSPISISKAKLSSLPMDICLIFKFLLPLKLSEFTKSNFLKLFLYPLNNIPLYNLYLQLYPHHYY